MKDYFTIFRNLFKKITGLFPNGLSNVFTAILSSVMIELQYKLNFIKKQAFISTADEEYLLLHTGGIVERYTDTHAQGKVFIFGDIGSIYDVNLVGLNKEYILEEQAIITEHTHEININIVDNTAFFECDLVDCKCTINGIEKEIQYVGNKFETDAIGLIDGVAELKANCALVEAVSKDKGSEQNLPYNTVLKTKTVTDGINSDAYVQYMNGAKDLEDLEDYRERCKEFFRNPQAPFSKNHIEFTAKKTVKYANAKKDGVDIVIYALNEDYDLLVGEKNTIQQDIGAIAHIGFANGNIKVVKPGVENIVITIKNLYPNSKGIKSQIKKNLEYFFKQDMFEKSVSEDELKSIIYNTSNGNEKPISFLVNGSYEAVGKTTYKLDRVEYVSN